MAFAEAADWKNKGYPDFLAVSNGAGLWACSFNWHGFHVNTPLFGFGHTRRSYSIDPLPVNRWWIGLLAKMEIVEGYGERRRLKRDDDPCALIYTWNFEFGG